MDQLRDTGVPSAFDKAGTPVMGGAVMVGCIVISTLLWCNLANRFVLTVLFALLWFGAIGLVDDVAKWRARSGNLGMTEAMKLLLQAAFAFGLDGAARQPVDAAAGARGDDAPRAVREDRRSRTRRCSTCRWSSSS